MQIAHIFKPVHTFGEITIITKSRRTGTVVCSEQCHLMSLEQSGFDNMMGVQFFYFPYRTMIFYLIFI